MRLRFQKIVSMWNGASARWRGAVFAVLVVCAAVLLTKEGSVEYEIEPVSVGSVVSTITSVGTLKHFEEAEIHSSIQGIAVEVLKEQGDSVVRGDVLIRLDSTAFKALYAKARAEFETTEAEFKYQSELYDKQLTSANDYNKARIAMEQAKAEFSEAKKKLEATEVRSPIDGTVISRSVEAGRSVDNKGGVLMRIAGNFDKMKLLIRVSEADIGRVSKGQLAHFTVSAFKDRAFAGTILLVPGTPLEGTGVVTYEVSAFVENPEHMLKSGMTADVTVKTAQVDNVVRIPTAALRFLPPDGSAHASKSAVWIKTVTGKAKAVPVTIGESNEFFAEVQSGEISEGDKVIVGILRDSRKDNSGSMTLPQPKRF